MLVGRPCAQVGDRRKILSSDILMKIASATTDGVVINPGLWVFPLSFNAATVEMRGRYAEGADTEVRILLRIRKYAR